MDDKQAELGTVRIPVLKGTIGEEAANKLMIQALPGGLCTHNYGWFEWKPCHCPTVALIWWDNEITRSSPAHRWVCGVQVGRRHLIMMVKAARAMGAVIVGRK